MGPEEHTEDLVSRRRPHPAEKVATSVVASNTRPIVDVCERTVQRSGTTCLMVGLVGVLGTVIVVALGRDALRVGRPPFVTFSILVAALCIFSAFFAAGLAERLNRYGRTMDRANTLQLTAVVRQGERQAEAQAEHAALLGGLAEVVSSLAERIEAVERTVEKVPTYPEAVLDGVDLARGFTGDATPRG